MTVILLARATDGIVVAGDGRTRITKPPWNIDNARKVRVHPTGAGGLVTASSGRATIGIDRTIAEVEEKFFKDFTPDSDCSLPEMLAQHLRQSIKGFNLAQSCTCASNYGECVSLLMCEVCGVFQDFDKFAPQPDCERCRGISAYEWIDPEGCPCSPGEHTTASKPSIHEELGEWCRCSALSQKALTWLCVPFGPMYAEGYGQPVTADIGPNHTTDIVIKPITDLVVIQGELTSHPTIAVNVESETVTAATAYAHSKLADLANTRTRIQDLLRIAYAEAPSNAVVRTLTDTLYTPDMLGFDENLDSITITDLANKIQAHDADKGLEKPSNGGPTIGGVATYVSIDVAGNATPPTPISI
ncbi:hypothetical protein ACWGK5_16785 [Rhodococcus qingshengii]